LTAADVTQAITDAHQAFGRWRQTAFTERVRLMKCAAAGSAILVVTCPDKVTQKP
jgi:acyl-CoA reductase-like NAD-dependent aldehyde dehydrogenase